MKTNNNEITINAEFLASLAMPAVTPMISDGTDGSAVGVDHRLIKATFGAKVDFDAFGFKDSHTATIYRTGDNFFIGLIHGDIGERADGVLKITYMDPAVVTDLHAKYGAGCGGNEEWFEKDPILQATIAAVEHEATQTHPITPWDEVTDVEIWKQSCYMM